MLGTLVGFLAGLLGIGGGLLIVPALVFLLDYLLHIPIEHAMPIAIASSLSTVIFTGLSSARTHWRLGNLSRSIMLFCGIGIAVGASAGAHFASAIAGVTLQRIFAICVMLIALQMAFMGRRRSQHSVAPWGMLAIGLFTGFMSALMGIGGGALLVPLLVWFQVDIRRAIGCAAFCGIIVALFGTANFIYTGWQQTYLPAWSLGYVFLPATLGIALTSVLIAPIGARFGQNVDTGLLKKIFAGFLAVVSLRMIIGLE